ncbi:MAG: Uma2 family endonuclease [Acidobacteria bacterium]|nr:Uma2 family endonuclease [Acidobacteriota bacterium]
MGHGGRRSQVRSTGPGVAHATGRRHEPRSGHSALQRKMEEYRANGARLGWLIDPERRRVTIYRADASLEQRAKPDVVTGETVLPGFSLDLAAIWTPAF